VIEIRQLCDRLIKMPGERVLMRLFWAGWGRAPSTISEPIHFRPIAAQM
jgi:hypothetical protein